MDNFNKFKQEIDKIKILRHAKHTIFTFCPTDIRYYLVTEFLNTQLVEVRKGRVKVEKPAIIKPSYLADIILEGFDKNDLNVIKKLIDEKGLRGLQYEFKNETENINLISGVLESIVDNINKEIDSKEDTRATVIQGVPEMWSISLMKGVIDIMIKSFPDNVKELEERGWFKNH